MVTDTINGTVLFGIVVVLSALIVSVGMLYIIILTSAEPEAQTKVEVKNRTLIEPYRQPVGLDSIRDTIRSQEELKIKP